MNENLNLKNEWSVLQLNFGAYLRITLIGNAFRKRSEINHNPVHLVTGRF